MVRCQKGIKSWRQGHSAGQGLYSPTQSGHPATQEESRKEEEELEPSLGYLRIISQGGGWRSGQMSSRDAKTPPTPIRNDAQSIWEAITGQCKPTFRTRHTTPQKGIT